MFTRLVASAGKRSPFRSPAVIAGSIGAHVALLAGVIWASSPDPASEPAPAENEEVTYIDITEIPEPPETVFEEPETQQPAQPAAPVAQNTRAAQPRRTTTPSEPAAPTKEPAGFQELRTPVPTLGVPPADPSVQAVRAEDFGGRGKVGGTASGTPTASADTGRIGSGTQTNATSGTGSAPTGTFSSNMVDRAASLTNRDAIVRQLQRLYPERLKESRTEGTVIVQFVVTAEGRVDMSTVQVMSSTHELFTAAAMRVLKEFRFRPARKGDHNVRMLTSIPMQWELDR